MRRKPAEGLSFRIRCGLGFGLAAWLGANAGAGAVRGTTFSERVRGRWVVQKAKKWVGKEFRITPARAEAPGGDSCEPKRVREQQDTAALFLDNGDYRARAQDLGLADKQPITVIETNCSGIWSTFIVPNPGEMILFWDGDVYFLKRQPSNAGLGFKAPETSPEASNPQP